MTYDPSQAPPSLRALAESIFDYAAQAAADDVGDDAFIHAAGLESIPPVRVQQDLLALYLYALLVLVPPTSTGMSTLNDEAQRALLNAVWYQFYRLHLSLGALTPDQIQAKTEALVSRWDDIYEHYQQARFDEEDREWGTSVIRFFLQDIEGVADPTPRQINTLASRVSYLVETFPSTTSQGKSKPMMSRLWRLLRR